jgi:hypothetical protein
MSVSVSTLSQLTDGTDHISVGFIVKRSDDVLVHITRIDPGATGDHVGNTGKIVKRTSSDNGATWSSFADVFSDIYDDRNVTGGITSTGRIVVFFRRLDAPSTTIDVNRIYSDDGGENWSARSTIPVTTGVSPQATNMFFVPTKGYCQIVINQYFAEALFSSDGDVWGSNVTIFDDTVGQTTKLNESSAVYIGDGKVLMVFRDDDRLYGSNPYQITSDDYMVTFSSPAKTNLTDSQFATGQGLFYDSDTEQVIATHGDRRGLYLGSDYLTREGLWFYANHPLEVFEDPTAWRFQQFVPRPEQSPASGWDFYGYPNLVHLGSSQYYGIVTERDAGSGGTEKAWIYDYTVAVTSDGTMEIKQ